MAPKKSLFMTKQFLWQEIPSTWLAKMHFIGGPSISSGSKVPRFHHSRASPNGGSLDFQGQWIKQNYMNIFLCCALSGFPLFSCYHVYEINIYMFIYLISFNEIYLINILDIVRTPTHQTPSPPEHFLGDFNQSVGPWAQ